MWNIRKIIKKGDYNYVLVPEHPRATKNGYVLEHRVVMENSLKRLLDTDEIVHHEDGNKKNNNLANLSVLDKREHASLHGKERGRSCCELVCPNCGISFIRAKGQTHLHKRSKATFCSRKCNGSFAKRKQSFGLTTEMKLAISGNIVKEIKVFNDNPEQTTDNGMRRDYTPTP